MEALLRGAAELPDKPRSREELIDLLVDLLGLPCGTAGGIVADPVTATVVGLAAARYRVLADVGWDVDARGLVAAPPVTVVVGDDAHAGLFRALRLLGLGRERVVRIRTDGQGRMRPTLIPPLHPPAIVCTQVGEAASGAVDPVAAVCAEVHDADAWVHVDGSFGLWAAASPLTRDLLTGVAYADSWATAAPDDSGLVFARDAGALQVALELTRPAPGVYLDRAGVVALVEDACGQARRLAAGLAKAGFPVLNEVVLDRVVVGVDDGGTRWRGRPAMFLRAGHGLDVDAVIRALMR